MAYLGAHWFNTTEIFLYTIIFAAISGEGTATSNFTKFSCIELLCKTWNTQKGNWTSIEKEAKCQKVQQTLGNLLAALLCIASPLLIASMDEDIFGDLLWDEPIGLNACSDSIENLVLV